MQIRLMVTFSASGGEKKRRSSSHFLLKDLDMLIMESHALLVLEIYLVLNWYLKRASNLQYI